MPYLVASMLTILTAMTLLLTRYETDDSTIKAELANMKVMFSMVDGFVNNYVKMGGNITVINFRELEIQGLLLNNSTVTVVTPDNNLSSTLILPNSDVVWHLLPNINDSSSYQLLVDVRNNAGLMNRPLFSESFIGREFCEKLLFGTFESTRRAFNGIDDFVDNNGANNDGLFVCVVTK